MNNVENKLFHFEAAQGDSEIIEYFTVTLKTQLGEFPTGHTFHQAKLNTENGTLSFYAAGVLVGRFSVELVVTKDLLNEE